MITCCYHCQRRRAGCHGDCPEYRAERARHLEQQAAAWLEKQRQTQAEGVLAEGARKMKRRNRNSW